MKSEGNFESSPLDERLDRELFVLMSELSVPETPADMHARVCSRLRQRRTARFVCRTSIGLALGLVCLMLVSSLPTLPSSHELAGPNVSQPALGGSLTDAELEQIFAQPPVDTIVDLGRNAYRAFDGLIDGEDSQ